jgi:outer membrane protein assembly factor BamE
MRIPLILSACVLVAGCSLVYRIDVQQGNYVTEDAVQKLKNGMTKAEVRSVLGTPLLIDAFHANRWDYYFSNVKGGKVQEGKRFTVMFENDKMVSFGGTVHPPAAPPVVPGSAPAPAAAAPQAKPPPTPQPAPSPAPSTGSSPTSPK